MSVWCYKNVRKNDGPTRPRIQDIAETRVRYIIERIVLPRREGWENHHKRVYCIYKEEELNLRGKRPRVAGSFTPLRTPSFFNLHDCRSVDFLGDLTPEMFIEKQSEIIKSVYAKSIVFLIFNDISFYFLSYKHLLLKPKMSGY